MYLTVPVIFVLFFCFGDNPIIFDRIYTISLLVLSLFCVNDKDILSCISILLLFWLASDVIFSFETLYAKPVIYTLSACICYSFYRHLVAKISLVFIFLALAAEVYWFSIDYESSPEIYYHVGMISITTAAILILPKRLELMAQWFNHLSGRNALDHQVIIILKIYLFLHYLNLLEYFVRHVFAKKEVTFIYEWFPLLSGLMSAATLAVIFIIFFHNKAKSYMFA